MRVVPACVGVYVHGSTGSDRLRPQSDLDVLAVIDAPLSTSERADLTTLLLRASGRYPRDPGGLRPIELTVVVRSDVVPWRYPPRCELQYGEWLRQDVEAGHQLASFVSPDLAVVLSMVLSCDAPLFGPSALDVLETVPTRDVVRATTDAVPALLEDLPADTANVLLTLARAWYTATTGSLVSKDEAASWACERAPSSVAAVLDRASAAYLDGTVHLWGPVQDDTRHAAQFLHAAIAATSAPTT